MYSSYLTMQVARLLLSLAILLNCFAPAVDCSTHLLSANGNLAPGLARSSSPARPASYVSAQPHDHVFDAASHYSIAPTAALFPTLLTEGTNGKLAFTSD